MTREELIAPRWKQVFSWPYMGENYKVGKIHQEDGIVTKYPHLFQKLEWYEDRKPEDMPQYIKSSRAGGIVVKVETHVLPYGNKWDTRDARYFEAKKKEGFFFDGVKFQYNQRDIPATEGEYLEYRLKELKIVQEG